MCEIRATLQRLPPVNKRTRGQEGQRQGMEAFMSRRSPRRRVLQAGLLSLLVCTSIAAAQGDPLALQQQAIRRLDGFIDYFRKTGDMRSRLNELAQAEAELSASNR